jgi:hypothetical protein
MRNSTYEVLTGFEVHYLPSDKGRKVERYPCNRLWRPIGLWGVEAPTSSRESVHRWRGQIVGPTPSASWRHLFRGKEPRLIFGTNRINRVHCRSSPCVERISTVLQSNPTALLNPIHYCKLNAKVTLCFQKVISYRHSGNHNAWERIKWLTKLLLYRIIIRLR